MKKNYLLKQAFISLALAMPMYASAQENLADKYMTNPDFEYKSEGVLNTGGGTVRGIPYGWEVFCLDENGEQTEWPGDSRGINNDGIGYHGDNLCWFYNKTKPMPHFFELSQTVTGLPAGTYTVKCLLFVQSGCLGTVRLFANNNVQYYGKESDYANNLTQGESNTFAGYEGSPEDNKVLKEMQVNVTIKEGDNLMLGIHSSCQKSDGSYATSADDITGWFKCDYFQIYKADPTGINSVTVNKKYDGNIYNLEGQKVANPKHGVFIKNGKKFVVK